MKKLKNNSETAKIELQSFLPAEEILHIYSNKRICITDTKGHTEPDNKDLAELVLDSSEGFIPLWDENVILNWRFDKSINQFLFPLSKTKEDIKNIFAEAVLSWGDSCPIKFSENDDIWDFEITLLPDRCNNYGCVLASAFFPQQGRDKLVLYPKLFTLSHEEQVETLAHELGHIFGLRHFFAKISEIKWSSEIFGEHNPFTIMNYGDESKMTITDISDLKLLYSMVWSKKITQINGTEIKLFKSYHMK